MASVLNKDPASYAREKASFLRDLQHFHDTRGTPSRVSPKIDGKDIDLYLLYVLVTAQGGWVKVSLYLILFKSIGSVENSNVCRNWIKFA
ncbi:Uncharacterized protein FWK35_00016071 [Aphis craccivora]|uniref:ARID domain-containing protein n=1 Tax=Aphis craccivora TaxID=307492 RepID=A0A6G0YNA0_APHCR|nr:Uncharacterized protein FWK35_00016071 [Aphis craccivora]